SAGEREPVLRERAVARRRQRRRIPASPLQEFDDLFRMHGRPAPLRVPRRTAREAPTHSPRSRSGRAPPRTGESPGVNRPPCPFALFSTPHFSMCAFSTLFLNAASFF